MLFLIVAINTLLAVTLYKGINRKNMLSNAIETLNISWNVSINLN